jgi:SHS2 domain-containing protein
MRTHELRREHDTGEIRAVQDTAGRRFVEHVGEVELVLEAASEEGLFAEATAAFRELVDGAGAAGEPLRHELELRAPEPGLLLADWLDELVFLAEVEGFVPLRVTALELDDRGGLRAALEGVRGRPRHLVKGATLHRLELARNGGEWHARVVLDV